MFIIGERSARHPHCVAAMGIVGCGSLPDHPGVAGAQRRATNYAEAERSRAAATTPTSTRHRTTVPLSSGHGRPGRITHESQIYGEHTMTQSLRHSADSAPERRRARERQASRSWRPHRDERAIATSDGSRCSTNVTCVLLCVGLCPSSSVPHGIRRAGAGTLRGRDSICPTCRGIESGTARRSDRTSLLSGAAEPTVPADTDEETGVAHARLFPAQGCTCADGNMVAVRKSC